MKTQRERLLLHPPSSTSAMNMDTPPAPKPRSRRAWKASCSSPQRRRSASGLQSGSTSALSCWFESDPPCQRVSLRSNTLSALCAAAKQVVQQRTGANPR